MMAKSRIGRIGVTEKNNDSETSIRIGVRRKKTDMTKVIVKRKNIERSSEPHEVYRT